MGIKDDKRAKFSNSEILLTGYLAVSDFNGNYTKAYSYIEMMQLVNLPEYSRFIRRINTMEEVLNTLFVWLGKLFEKTDISKIYSVDSFPVELCSITREKRCRLWNDPRFKGYNASKAKFFYGLKVHMVVNTDKAPIYFYISEGSMHDINAAYNFYPIFQKILLLLEIRVMYQVSLSSFCKITA